MRARSPLALLVLAILLSSAPAASAAPLRAKGTQSSRASSAAAAGVILGPLTMKIPDRWAVAEKTAKRIRLAATDAGGKDASIVFAFGEAPVIPKGATLSAGWLLHSDGARKADYAFVRDGTKMRGQILFMAVDGVFYALTYEAPDVNFERYLRDADRFSWDMEFTDERKIPAFTRSSSPSSARSVAPKNVPYTVGDVTFDYPRGWHVTDLEIGKRVSVAADEDSAPSFYVTVKKVAARDLDAKGLDAWADNLMTLSSDTRSIADDWFIPSIIKRWDPADATMLGRPARLYRYTRQGYDGIEYGELTAVSVGDRIITLHFRGRATMYDYFKDYRDEIRASFRFAAASAASSRRPVSGKAVSSRASSRGPSSSARSRR